MKQYLAWAALALAAGAHAQVNISEPWVRGTVPAQKSTGAFMRIQAEQDVRLVAGATPVAGVVEIHEMAMDGDVMKMRQLKDGLPIAKGATAELKPGGYHVMLLELKQPLTAGETVPLTLTFEDASHTRFTREVQAPVRPLNAGNAPMHPASAAEH
ncbi:MAG: copper chaperone PCu(A)C [Burkholderiaceae bacterium]|jgi:copper(I)-binding protein|nr:copper chaperone PCu(A)C [Burkholderiaceae bacterium]